MAPFINDSYRQSRGNWSRWLAVSCEKCGAFLFHYQKDGSGPLKRCYRDRIKLANHIADQDPLVICRHCEFPFGLALTYQKENRPAIRLFAAAVLSRVVPANQVG